MEQLPNEILIHILQYLNTYDLVQFCNVFESLDYFLQEKDVNKCLDLSNKFEIQDMNLCRYISIKMNPDYIKILKINSIYWIPSQDLRTLLSKLPVLEELYATDTKLGLRSVDIVEYIKLKKLAVSVKVDHFKYENVMESNHLKLLLKCLSLKIIKEENSPEIDVGLRLFCCNICCNLQELWIQDDFGFIRSINFEIFIVEMENLLKFVLRSKSFFSTDIFPIVGFSKSFECKNDTEGELIFTKVLDKRPNKKYKSEPTESALKKAWDKLGTNLPCGLKESELLNKEEEEITKIQFEELNFCHSYSQDHSEYVDAAIQILESKNCRGLKKLKFKTCLFQNFHDMQMEEFNTTPFKKARIGDTISDENHPFEKIAKHFINLVELEILICFDHFRDHDTVAVLSAYPLITNFGKLKRLTLEIPIQSDGSFLKQVFQKCQHLEYLNLTSNSNNYIFLQNLYQYLKCAESLKHFRLLCPLVNLERLFVSFYQMPSRKLLRMFIQCDNIIYSSTNNDEELLSLFFETHPQLIFFYLAIERSTYKQITNIQKVFNEYEKSQPGKVFYCKRVVYPYKDGHIPPAHLDFVINRTRVSVIDFELF